MIAWENPPTFELPVSMKISYILMSSILQGELTYTFKNQNIYKKETM